jgi:hypothetical protein
MRLRVAVRTLLVGGLGVIGCQAIAGIEDRSVEPMDSGTGVTDNCLQYCNDVMQACDQEHNDQQYANIQTCQDVCAKLQEGDVNEPVGNTVACRETEAKVALKDVEPNLYCKGAGPGGDGYCATPCENYCALFDAVCDDVSLHVSNCVDLCKELIPPGDDTNVAAAQMGNTLACRFYHVSAAAASKNTKERTQHCGHAGLNPTALCVDDTNVDCDTYCKTVDTLCGFPDGGTYSVYESRDQCLAVCAALPPGPATDMSGNTVGCRTYHSWNAVLLGDSKTHCPHAGPGGAGVCGDDCESYCKLFQAACSTEFTANFTGMDDCQMKCRSIPGDPGYTLPVPDGNTLQCRLHYTARALEDAASSPDRKKDDCAAALGTATCK